MVAVISGNGLGLGNTSLTQLGGAPGGSPSLGQAGNASYLNAATGNLILQSADEGLLFDGLPLNVLRTYNSQGALNGQADWRYGFSRSIGGLTGTLNTAGSTVTRTGDDGSMVVYTYDTDRGLYVSSSQSGAEDTLTWDATSSTWTYTDAADQIQETYDASGTLSTLTDTATGASYRFSYSNGQLSQIVAGDGDTLLFDYNTAGQLIDLKIQEVPPGQSAAITRQAVSYGYDAQGRLTSVTTNLTSDTDTAGGSYTTSYTYDGTSDRVASVTQSDGTTVSYGYTQDAQGAWQVTSITTGSGADAQTVTLSYGTNDVIVTDALGNSTTYQTNAAGQLTAVIAPTVNGSSPTTTYTYDANGNVLTMTDPLGAVTNYTYDANGNLTGVEDPTGHTISYTYDANDRVTSQTLYTVPAQGTVGQSGYVAPSGAQTTTYIYDSQGRLSYTVDPLGNVTEHDYTVQNGLSLLTGTIQYVGASYATSGSLPALADLQAWVASTAVQSVLSQSQRTDYTYDLRGQMSQRIQWDVLDAQGQGTLAGDTGAVVTTYTYDAQGRLLQTGTQRGSTLDTTRYAYDGLGRVLSVTDPLGHVTTTTYADATQTQITTQANGLVTTQVRNTAGLLLSSTQSATGQASRTTTYTYDADGRLRAVEDPDGVFTFTFYDADGRVAGVTNTVNGEGAVTGYTYDADGRIVATTQYAEPIAIGTWVSNGALTASLPATLFIPASTSSDRISYIVYDAAGRVVATVSPVGAVVTTTYDGEGHAIGTYAYAQELTGTALSSFLAAPSLTTLQQVLPTGMQDRATHAYYDADGRVAAVLDASGHVTISTFDSAGRVVATTAYATALLSVPSTLADLLTAVTPSVDDITTRNYYDDAGRQIAQVDADGYLTTTAYDESSHTTTTTRYAVALTLAQQAALTGEEDAADLAALLGPAPASETSACQYDADGRKSTETAMDGTVTQYTYNSVGQLTQTVVTPGSGQGAARTSSASYDAFGDVLSQTDATGATTAYTYTPAGLLATSTDALGNTTYDYYTPDGVLAYIVQGESFNGVANARGVLTTYRHNLFGEQLAVVNMAETLTLTESGASSGATLNVATATYLNVLLASSAVSSSADTGFSTEDYTTDGRLESIDNLSGYSTTYRYDAFGDAIQTQQQLSQPGSALSTANSTTTAYTYDALGERTGETDGVGSNVARSTSVQYDAFGRVIQATDGNGNTVSYAYDALGRQISSSQVVQGVTRTTQNTYDAFGRVVTQTDALGHTTTYQYDTAQHRVTVTSPDGVVTTMTQDAYGDTVAVTDGNGQTTTRTYDADGRLLTVTDPLGRVTTNQYDADGELLRTTDAAGQVVAYTYDGQGHALTRTVDPDGLALTTTYVYDGIGHAVSVTDPSGVVTTMQYDSAGNLVQQVEDVGGANRTTTYTYDGADQTLSVTTAAGTAAATTTQFVYDKLERLSQRIVDPTGLVLTTRYTYDANGNVTSVTDPNGNVTHTIYNEANEAVLTIDPTGAMTQIVYDADGRATVTRGYATRLSSTQLASLNASPTLATLQGFNLATTAQDSYRQTVYNADGQIVYTLDGVALNPTLYTYNSAGQVTQTRQYAHALSSTAIGATATPSDIAALLTPSANDIVTTTAYDADGEAVYTIDGAGDVTQAIYDADGRVVATIAYATPLSSSQLAALGSAPTPAQIAAVLTTSVNDRRTDTAYDTAGRIALTVDPTGAVMAYTYDADGRVTSTHAYATALTAAQRASLGNTPSLAAIQALLTPSAADPIGYRVYDALGELRYAIDPLGNVTETRYDAAGRVSEALAYPQAVAVSSEVTALQQGTALGWLSGQVGGTSGANADSAAVATLNLYDTAGRLRFIVQQNANGTQGTVTEQRYDANGNVIARIAYGQLLTLVPGTALSTQLTTANVTSAVANFAHETTSQIVDADNRAIYTVDALGHVTQVAYDAFGRVLQTTQYAHPIAIPVTLTASTVAAAVTAAGGATGARVSTATYDSRGDVLTTGDALGVNATYTYDGRGLKTSMTNRDGAVWQYSYDTAGRLVQTQSPAVTVGSYSPVNGAFQTAVNQFIYTTTVYDAFGEVHSVSEGSGSSASAIGNVTTTTYSYDADGRTVATTNAIDVTTRTTYNALGQTVVSQDGNGYFSYRSYNLDGQLAYAIDGNGEVTGYTYDAYGNATGETAYATALDTAAIAGWSAGQPLSLAQVQQGLVTSGNDRSVTTTYNQLNQVTQVQSSAIAYAASMGALGGTGATGVPTTTYAYDAYGNQVSRSVLIQGALTSGSLSTPAIWATTTTYYDALNRVVMTIAPTGDATAPQGYVTTTGYDAFGEISTVTQYAQAISTAALTSTPPALPPAGNATVGFDRTTQYVYDSVGRVLSRTDLGGMTYTGGTPGLQNGSTANYSANNASSVVSYTYDGEGRVLTQTVNGATTTTTYDALGRTLTVTAPARQALVSNWQTLLLQNPTWDLTTAALYITVSPVTSYVYDAHGNTLSTHVASDTLSTQTWSYYDAIGRMIEQFDPTGVAHFTTYDANGNVLTQSYTLTNAVPVVVTTTRTYDAANRQLSAVTQRAGTSTPDSATYVKYDAFGEVIAQGDGVISASSPTGYAFSYTYDNAGNQLTAPNSTNGAIHTFSYDLAGHLVVDASTVTGGSAQTWTHNVLNLAGQVVTAYTPSSLAASGVAGTTPETYTYDRWGNVLTQIDSNGNRTAYAYDSQDHLIQQTEAAVVVVSATGAYSTQTPVKQWFYNIDGELMAVRDENGLYTDYTYDPVGHLRAQQDATGAFTYTDYDALGRAVAQQTPTVQTVTGPTAPINTTAYNALDQVIGQGAFLQAGPGAARTLQSEGSYLLNSHGDRIQSTDAMGNTTRYSYDSQHRILTGTTPLSETTTYVYDVNGHLIHQTSAAGYTQSWVYNDAGQMLSHVDESGATYTYTYDAHSGLLTTETSNWTATGPSGSTTSTLNFQYEANGEIAQLSETVSGVVSTYAYQYDADGNEIHETDTTQDGSGAAVATQTLMAYDSHNRLQEVTEENGAGTAATMRTVYVYDAVGNRRAVFAQSAYANGALSSTPISLATGAPAVTAALATQTIQPGNAVNYTVPATSFSDPLGMGLTYTATGLPSWLTFNAATRTFAGTPPIAPASYTVTVTAMDVLGRSVSSTVTITVPTVPPAFNSTPASQAVQYNGFNFTLPGAVDANGFGITYSMTCNGGALPSWMSFNPSTLVFSGTPPVGSAGTYTLGLIAKANGTSAQTMVSFSLTVAAVTAPQFTAAPPNPSVTINNGFAFTVPNAVDANGLAVVYTTGYWNGSAWVGLPSWISFNASTRTFSGTAPSTYQTATFAVWATGAGTGVSSAVTFTLTVNAPPVYNGALGNNLIPYVEKVPAGSSLSINAASLFTNPTGRALVYQLVWGNNGQGGAVTFNTSTGLGTLLATGTQGTNYPYSLIATDPVDGLSATVNFTLEVESKIGTPPGPPHTQVVSQSADITMDDESAPAPTPAPTPVTSAQTAAAEMIVTPQILPTPDLLPIDSPPRISIGNPPPSPAPTPVATPSPSPSPTPPPPSPAPAPVPGFVANWFTYDNDNRVVIADGSLQNGQIVMTTATNSGQNTYDQAGNLTQYTALNSSGQMLSERAYYDTRNNLVLLQAQTTVGGVFASYQSGNYDADGHLIRSTTYQLLNHTEAGVFNNALVTFRDDGWIASDTVYTYNADGELVDQSLYAEESAQNLINQYQTATAVQSSAYAVQETSAPGAIPSPGSTTDGSLFLVTDNSYAATGAGYGYDADQNLLGYHVITGGAATIYNNAPTATTVGYTNTFARQNSGLIVATTDTTGNTTTNTYNALGELTKTSGLVSGTQQTTVMAYTAGGQILQKTTSVASQPNEVTNYLYAQNSGLGSEDNLKGINVLATTGGFSNGVLGMQGYTVQVGDTLDSVAQAMFGDSSYAYLIAQANGLQLGSPLTVGMVLHIPQVTTSTNSAHVFQPYAQNAIVSASQSACVTTAQMVVLSIQAVLDQQSALAATIQQIEQAQSNAVQQANQGGQGATPVLGPAAPNTTYHAPTPHVGTGDYNIAGNDGFGAVDTHNNYVFDGDGSYGFDVAADANGQQSTSNDSGSTQVAQSGGSETGTGGFSTGGGHGEAGVKPQLGINTWVYIWATPADDEDINNSYHQPFTFNVAQDANNNNEAQTDGVGGAGGGSSVVENNSPPPAQDNNIPPINVPSYQINVPGDSVDVSPPSQPIAVADIQSPSWLSVIGYSSNSGDDMLSGAASLNGLSVQDLPGVSVSANVPDASEPEPSVSVGTMTQDWDATHKLWDNQLFQNGMDMDAQSQRDLASARTVEADRQRDADADAETWAAINAWSYKDGMQFATAPLVALKGAAESVANWLHEGIEQYGRVMEQRYNGIGGAYTEVQDLPSITAPVDPLFKIDPRSVEQAGADALATIGAADFSWAAITKGPQLVRAIASGIDFSDVLSDAQAIGSKISDFVGGSGQIPKIFESASDLRSFGGLDVDLALDTSIEVDTGANLKISLPEVEVVPNTTADVSSLGNTANASGQNIVYRALTEADATSIANGGGLVAKAPDGTWTAAEHVANSGPGEDGAAANSPWISTTRSLDVAQGYDSGNGIIAIDLNQVDSLQAEVWQTAPRVNGVDGLPYHRSIWSQEVTIYQSIPQKAIIGHVGQ